MRLRHPAGRTIHLAYCTNVHPAEDLPGVVSQLDRFALPVRERLGADRLGLGLWLAAPVAAALAEDRGLRLRLRGALTDRGLEVVTLNGFPYQAFHAPVVKHRVYRPDWTERSRLEYTLDLAAVLRDLLPDDAERGSISTLPFGWRGGWGTPYADRARALLGELAAALRRDGRIRVALEPEPGCVVETAEQALAELASVDTEQIGVCLDLAHLACAWEDPADTVKRLEGAGIPIVKAQVSAALEVADPWESAQVLADYAEPRFLHQTRSAGGHAFDDLPNALASDAPGPWRVHFHVPLHAAPSPPLRTTTDVLDDGLAALMSDSACDHLEVETYTWSALPEAQRPVDDAGLVAGIAAELAYARDRLRTIGVA
jgi:sugar phosphate isomerase/epimerase